MTAPKKYILRVKKNQYGNPIVSVRSYIGEFTFEGKVYDTVHMYLNIGGGELTLRSKKHYESVGCLFRKDSFEWPDTSAILRWVESAIKEFKEGKIPHGIELHFVQFGVLI